MNDNAREEQQAGIELEYDIDEPPQKVWRALSLPDLRERWLPEEVLADPEAVVITPGEEVRYSMRDAEPPFLESTVTFRIASNATGGTLLTVIHELEDARLERKMMTAANSCSAPVMLAA
jgi:uncharacterized protein YndB with AHSA1/START domain